MKLNFTINNITYSKFVKDEHITDMGTVVNDIINSKLEGGTIDYTSLSGEVTNFNASEIQAITIEF